MMGIARERCGMGVWTSWRNLRVGLLTQLLPTVRRQCTKQAHCRRRLLQNGQWSLGVLRRRASRQVRHGQSPALARLQRAYNSTTTWFRLARDNTLGQWSSRDLWRYNLRALLRVPQAQCASQIDPSQPVNILSASAMDSFCSLDAMDVSSMLASPIPALSVSQQTSPEDMGPECVDQEHSGGSVSRFLCVIA